MNEERLARKIPLEALLDHLEELYTLGVDYIDITSQLGDEFDTIGIVFCKEYMEENYQTNFDELSEAWSDEIEGEPFDPNNIDDII